MQRIRITAVICTLNREAYLVKAIDSLVHQSVSRDEYEILVIDNRSTDGTRAAVERLQECTPNLRYIYEPIAGLSQARNTAWRNARGEYVAYLDDDAVADPRWIESILNAFERTSDRTGCVGGKILPQWEAPRPAWLPDSLLYFLGNLDFSPDLTPIHGPTWLGGGNSAYPKAVLEKVEGFDTRVGRKGKNLLSMEDTLMQQKLISLGYEVFYHPGISILHAATKERLEPDWFERRSFWEGVSDALATHENFGKMHFIWRVLKSFLGICLKPTAWRGLAVRPSRPELFEQRCQALRKLGFLRGALKFGGWGWD